VSVFLGGCLCGALRYEARGTPLCGHCYCADCRKASGSGFIPFMSFPHGAVTFSGAARQYSSPSASGRVAVRNFCPTCGALVFGGLIGNEHGHTIYAGSLDDASLFKPTVAIFTQGRPPWAVIPPDFKTYPGLPDA
jgi:hypothetical protein